MSKKRMKQKTVLVETIIPPSEPSCPDCEVFIDGQWRTGVCDECDGSGESRAGRICKNCKGTGSPVCCRCEGTGVDLVEIEESGLRFRIVK